MMQTHWLRTGIGCFLFGLLMVLVSCHEEPALPDSIVPYQCRIAQVEIIDTTYRSTTAYEYDKSGNLTKIVFPSGTRTYTYDSEGYLTKTEDGGTVLTYQYESNPKRIKEISGGTLKYSYAYEGDNLKTYSIQNGTAVITYTYSAGQLSDIRTTPTDIFKVQNGKISQEKYTNGAILNDIYNNLDQLVSQEYIFPNGMERRVYTYTYDDDSKISYSNTGLFFKGFPKLGQGKSVHQPGPYMNSPGRAVATNNILTLTETYYRKVGTGWGDPLFNRTLRYKHAYYQNRYSLGYARSDGQRVRYTYSNCE
ncbi:hypothetical protein DYU11_08965 [Fibrisoma montanum]|uniref:RHS repeat protein n=1 Tax=Fibrisoma montanum TaxID=2305895 RepID=A0A418MF38_9BACT|nr:RHS repeat domain-containing protein [Fibrisoma montanum]RIV25418.1 hypothetical protein DYU11_08965 [Fibrisoma montanum]